MPRHLVIASSWGLQVLLLSSFSCSSAALAAPDEDGRPRHGSFRHCHMRVKPLSISFSRILIFFNIQRHWSHLPISFFCSCLVFGMPQALCGDSGLLVRSLARWSIHRHFISRLAGYQASNRRSFLRHKRPGLRFEKSRELVAVWSQSARSVSRKFHPG